MRTGSSVPSPPSSRFTGSNVDVSAANASNSGSRSLGPRTKTKSEDALRNASIAQLWKPTSPPTSPRSPTSQSGGVDFAPKLDVVLPTSRGPGGGAAEDDDADEFGALLFSPSRDRVTLLSEEQISRKSLTPKDVLRLLQAASTVIHAQGMFRIFVATPHPLSLAITD